MRMTNPRLKVLLTGATGYVGSTWCMHPSSTVAEIVPLAGRIPDVDPDTLLDGIDVVVHLAAQLRAHTNDDVLRINTEWTERLGKACSERGVRLLFVSTSSVYSGNDNVLLSEDTACISPQTAYAASKYTAENALRELRDDGLSVCILRFGSVFGYASGMRFHGAINKFVKQAIEQGRIEVWKTAANQLRPYTHIMDCVAAINFVIEHNLFTGETFNVVSENATVDEVLREVSRAIPGVAVDLVTHEHMNEFSYGLSDDRIRSHGFIPRGTVRDGIDGVAMFLRSSLLSR
jgi:nucleoside-diphosphate-sugar epimerase